MSDQSILLSQSVAVTIAAPSQLQLLHPLEDIYRPRYKSDYFPQKGAVRRPRYITDNAKNHFVTIQVKCAPLWSEKKDIDRIRTSRYRKNSVLISRESFFASP